MSNKITSLFFLMCLLVSNTASALLIEKDLFTAGDSLVIGNTVTNTEYIRLSETRNTNAVNESMYGGLGFKWATLDELLVLYTSIGMPLSNGGAFASQDDLNLAKSATRLLTGSTVTAANFFVDDGSPLGIWSQLRFNSSGTYDTNIWVLGYQANGYSTTQEGWTGALMIRTAQVPVPAPLALLGIGALVLGFTRKKEAAKR